MARRGRGRGEDRTGGLVIWKPVGPTSRRIVDRAQRALGVRGLGHTGTLDPLASGIIVVVGGHARKFQELLTQQPKSYEARIEFGVESESQDAEGPLYCPLPRSSSPSLEEIQSALDGLVGRRPQTPPRHSAIKIGGHRSHKLARAGIDEEPEARIVDLDRATIRGYDAPRVDIELDCGSGYYVRSFARDLGEAVGTGAYLTRLRRTRVGGFDEGCATALGSLDSSVWLSLEDLLAPFPKLELPEEVAGRMSHGQRIDLEVPEPFAGSAFIVCESAGRICGIAKATTDQLAPRRWMPQASSS